MLKTAEKTPKTKPKQKTITTTKLFGKNEYWKRVTKQMDENLSRTVREQRIYPYDHRIPLPNKLYKRVQNILKDYYEEVEPYVFVDKEMLPGYLMTASIEEEEESDRNEREAKQPLYSRKTKKPVHFNESTCTEIENLELQFAAHDLHIDVLQTRSVFEADREQNLKKIPTPNWMKSYLCNKREKRVTWNSKIYMKDVAFSKKSPEEKVEMILDISAQRFIEWMGKIGRKRPTDFTKQQLRSLFALEPDFKCLSAVHITPTIVNAIPRMVADKWDMPHMAIEHKYAQSLQQHIHNVHRHVPKVAFGRTVPYKDRPWVPTEKDQVITYWPENMLSMEKVFNGIQYLKSTKKMIEYYRSHPKLKKPKFLVEKGLFKEKVITGRESDIPLYDRLKLSYE